MGGIVNTIVDVISTALTIVLFPVVVVTEYAWEYIGHPILEAIFNFLGIKDEEIISTEVITQRVINDIDGYNAAMVGVALNHQKDPNSSVIKHYVQVASEMRAKYMKYYTYGKDTYYRGLPSTNIRTTKMSLSLTKTALDTDLGISSTIIVASKDEPTKDSWVAWQLQNSNGFKPSTNELLINGVYNYVTSIDYNYTTDQYDVSYQLNEIVTTDVITTTTVTITNIDATTDNRNEVITEQTITTGDVSGLISDVTTTLSTIATSIPIGSEVDSTVSATTTSVTTVVVSSGIISVVAYVPDLYVIAKYYEVSNNDWYYWFYKIGTGTYPVLDDAATVYGTSEFMPVAVLRNNFINTNADKTSVAYLETQELLKTVGVDLDEMTDAISDSPDIGNVADAFIHFSINLSDNTPEISKLVYETFSQLFEDSGLYNDQGTDAVTGKPLGGYSAAIKELPYNTALGWKTQTRSVVAGSIGPVGTYQKLITTATNSVGDLVMRKQEAEEYYVEYIMTSVTGLTFIDRTGQLGTQVGSVGQNLVGGVELPLAFFFIDSLDFQEQTNIFPYTLKLSIYAASITYLKWYKTSAFSLVLQIIAIIVTVVVTVITVGTGASIGTILQALIVNLAIGLAVGYAMKLLMESNAPDWLKAVGAAIIIATVIYTGVSYAEGEFLSASQLTTAVTTASATSIIGGVAGAVVMGTQAYAVYTQVEMDKVQAQSEQFSQQADQRLQSFTAAEDLLVMGGVLDTYGVVDLVNKEIPEAYLRSVDAFYYQAKGAMQYEFNALFDYNIYKDDYISNQLRLGTI